MILGNGRPSLYAAHSPDARRFTPPPPTLKSLTNQLDQWVEAHPTICVAAALTLGVTLGWLIKRR
jgi:hypothetical protein